MWFLLWNCKNSYGCYFSFDAVFHLIYLGSRHHGPQSAMRVGELWGQAVYSNSGHGEFRTVSAFPIAHASIGQWTSSWVSTVSPLRDRMAWLKRDAEVGASWPVGRLAIHDIAHSILWVQQACGPDGQSPAACASVTRKIDSDILDDRQCQADNTEWAADLAVLVLG